MSEDQRKFFHLPQSVKVRWQKVSDDGATPQEKAGGVTMDISAGGVRLKLNKDVEPGDILKLEMDLGDTKTIKVQGKVMWVRAEHEAGVDFIDMDRQTRWELTEFIYKAHQQQI